MDCGMYDQQLPNHELLGPTSESTVQSDGVRFDTFEPPSPLDVAVASDADEADWISYPPFYAHVARLSSEGESTFGMRMRGADGRLAILHGPDSDLENVRRHVEMRWLHFLHACLQPIRRNEDDMAEKLQDNLKELEEIACPAPPTGARSPFAPLKLTEVDRSDLHRFPIGYPFVVETPHTRTRLSTGAMIRTFDLEICDFAGIVYYSAPGHDTIQWLLTIQSSNIENASPMSKMAVTRFHQDHCADRGVKAASYPLDETRAAPSC